MLRITLLSIVIALLQVKTAIAQHTGTVHLFVDASGSFGAVESTIDTAFSSAEPSMDLEYKLVRWDTTVLPAAFGQAWPVSGSFTIRKLRKNSSTLLGKSLRELLQETRAQEESCTRIIAIIHGSTADPLVLGQVLGTLTETEQVQILMEPMYSDQTDPLTDLRDFRILMRNATGGRGIPAQILTPETLQTALNLADEHRCFPNLM